MLANHSRVCAFMAGVCAAISAATLHAQSPVATPPAAPTVPASSKLPAIPTSAIPKSPAGDALREWLDAFNSGDSTRIASFLRTYRSDDRVQGLLGFRRMTGGFNLVSVVRSEPRRIAFFVQERNSPTTAVGELDLALGDSVGIVGPDLQAVGPNVPVTALHIDASARKRVIDRAAALLDSFYVFPDVAKRMGDSARVRLARGTYDAYDVGPLFARRLTDDLRAVSHDKHLAVRYSGRALPPPPANVGKPPQPSAEETAEEHRFLDGVNCGFDKVERMDGNIGYLKFGAFADADYCAPTVAAAMTFVANTRALIVDLRENGGGQPKMVALIASYLFDRRTHLNDLWTRSTDSTAEFWTLDSIAGKRFGGTKPVYVLTSSNTFSGAEEFTYDLKSLKRATIVGETTGGGAHPVRNRPIDEHFSIGVPFARAINPITKTNWEGVGVAPDRKVSAADALATALKLIGDPPR